MPTAPIRSASTSGRVGEVRGRRGDVGVAVPAEVHRPTSAVAVTSGIHHQHAEPGVGEHCCLRRGRRSGSNRRRGAARPQPGWPTGGTTRRATPRRRSAASRLVRQAHTGRGGADLGPRDVGRRHRRADDEHDERGDDGHGCAGGDPPREPPATRGDHGAAHRETEPAAARTSVATRTSSGPPLTRCGANPTATAIAGTPTMTATRPRHFGGSRSSAMTAAAVDAATDQHRAAPAIRPSRRGPVSTASAAPHSTVPRSIPTGRRTRTTTRSGDATDGSPEATVITPSLRGGPVRSSPLEGCVRLASEGRVSSGGT